MRVPKGTLCARLFGTALAVWAFGALLSTAEAQKIGLPLDNFRFAPSLSDGLVVSGTQTPGHLGWGAYVGADYANDPLVIEAVLGDEDSELRPLVAHQLNGVVAGYLGLGDRWMLSLALPVTLWRDDTTIRDLPDGKTAFPGDPRLGVRFRFVDVADGLFSGALQLQGTLPLSHLLDADQVYTGEPHASLHAQTLLAQRIGPVTVRENVGVIVREETSLAGVALDHALTYGLGVSGEVLGPLLTLYTEVYGSTLVDPFGASPSSPLAILGGARTVFAKHFVVGAGAGAGLLRGVGSPDVRAFLQLGYQAPAEEEAPEPAPIKREQPVLPPAVDSDGDGLMDTDDECVLDAEDADGFKDEDGCPDLDNDEDGVLDANDKCPLEVEDPDGFDDDDGCPDADNDGDGVADADDTCPEQAEDKDGFEDENGCPDLDNDRDAVPDTEDKCPNSPGALSEQGCPRFIAVDAEAGRIRIKQKVEFETGKSKLRPTAFPILEEVAATLAAQRSIKAVRFVGFTDSRGRDRRNLELSVARARSVRDWVDARLSQVAEASARLTLVASGCGELHPIASNRKRKGRAQNRRVEIEITDPAPEGGEGIDLEGCKAAE